MLNDLLAWIWTQIQNCRALPLFLLKYVLSMINSCFYFNYEVNSPFKGFYESLDQISSPPWKIHWLPPEEKK